MTLRRFFVLPTIAYLCQALLLLPTNVAADEAVLRPAATQARQDVTRRNGLGRDKESGPRVGWSPVPYKPQPREQRGTSEPRVHAGLPDIRSLVRRVNRSVVSLRMLDRGSSWSLGDFGFSRRKESGKATGYGAGFIISGQGHILTNEHVLRNGARIEVELLGGRKYPAKVLHKDGKNDLALLKIDPPAGLLPVEMGDSDAVELGEWVIGIGNPYGIGQSIMIGIVSAKHRSIPGSGYPPLIQIDAAMNLGNSGGPLFNMQGEVIGINTILLWKSQGIGFATPINAARQFLASCTSPNVKAASAPALGPMGPVADGPRAMQGHFNPLDPPWKIHR